MQDTLRTEESDLEKQKASLDDLVAQQEKLQAVTDQKVAEANAALARARVIGALHAAGEPVMGPSALTAAQMVAWYNAQDYHPRLETSINDLAQIFIDEGTDENVRGDFAFAQSIVETAGFNAAPDNNYSGIGWCDSCSTGNRFPNPREGVRGADPAAAQLRRRGCTRRQPPSSCLAVSLRFGSRCRGAEVRQLLRQGLGTDLERHGPRQLGDRPELRVSGDRRVPPDGGVRAGRLTRHASAASSSSSLASANSITSSWVMAAPRVHAGSNSLESSVSRTRDGLLAAGELLASGWSKSCRKSVAQRPPRLSRTFRHELLGRHQRHDHLPAVCSAHGAGQRRVHRRSRSSRRRAPRPGRCGCPCEPGGSPVASQGSRRQRDLGVARVARTALVGSTNTACTPSPVVFTMWPSCAVIASRRISSWRASAPCIASGCSSQRRVRALEVGEEEGDRAGRQLGHDLPRALRPRG